MENSKISEKTNIFTVEKLESLKILLKNGFR